MSEVLLRDIADYCRRARMATSTFGRLAVNDGKRLSEAIGSGAWPQATRSVLQQHGALWFWDESYVISRKRDSG